MSFPALACCVRCWQVLTGTTGRIAVPARRIVTTFRLTAGRITAAAVRLIRGIYNKVVRFTLGWT